MHERDAGKWVFKRVGAAVLVFIGLMIPLNTVVTVDAGTVGVVKQFGRVTGRVMQPGLNAKIPLVDSVIAYNTMEIVYETSPAEKMEGSKATYKDYHVDTTTQDGQQIDVSYSVRFRVEGDRAAWIANNLGNEVNLVEKVVKFHSRILARAVPKSYTAESLYTGDVTIVADAIAEQLAPLFGVKGIFLDAFGIREIKFTDDYIDAMEQKQIELERVKTEEHKAQQALWKKEATITEAEGEAQAIRIKGEAMAENPDIVQLKLVEALRDPESNVNYVFLPIEGLFSFLNVSDVMSSAPTQ